MLYAASYESTFLPPTTSLREALRCLCETALRVCLVVDTNRKLLGVVTDGDVRRAILAGADLEHSVEHYMNRSFFSMGEDALPKEIRSAMRARNIIQVPILNKQGQVTALASRFVNQQLDKEVSVILMAGGLGNRLRPLTETCPKPLLPLNGRPMLEHIMAHLRDQGLARFYIAVNYLGQMIEDYFGDGEQLGVDIRYLRERQQLGTAGALSLLPTDDISETLLVMNGDVVTDMPFVDFITFHDETGSEASMCVRETHQTLQFGVVQFDDGTNRYISTAEKPIIKNYINAGVYCLSKTALDLVPRNTPFDMPSLFDAVTLAGRAASVYPCDGFWIDVGRPEDYERAQMLFKTTDGVRVTAYAKSASRNGQSILSLANSEEQHLSRAAG